MAEKQTENRRRADQAGITIAGGLGRGGHPHNQDRRHLRLVRPPVMSRAAQAQSTPGLVSDVMGSKVPS